MLIFKRVWFQQGNLYGNGRERYHMCSCQSTVWHVILCVLENIFYGTNNIFQSWMKNVQVVPFLSLYIMSLVAVTLWRENNGTSLNLGPILWNFLHLGTNLFNNLKAFKTLWLIKMRLEFNLSILLPKLLIV